MNTDIENTVKQCATCLDYQQTQLHERPLLHEPPSKLWDINGANIFSINNSTLLCIADYYIKRGIKYQNKKVHI